MDPLDFRLKNAVEQGDRRADGPIYGVIGYRETVEAAKKSDHYQTPLEGKNRGRGVASGFWFNGGGASTASITVNDDGTVSLVEGSTDIGGSRASMAIVVAETLGIPVEHVIPNVGDTESIGYTDVTGGSSATYKTSLACHRAALSIREEVCRRAARMWETDPENVLYHDDGTLSCKTDPDKKLTFQQVAENAHRTGGPISAEASVNAGGAGPGFGTHIVDVEVDPETGKVTILRYTAVQDVGRAIHPAYVEGQIQGGVAQGIGWALNEEYVYNAKGELTNASFLDYRIPTALDLPMIETILVEVPNPNHPFGLRGVGEVPIVPPPAAIANAIYRATGVRLRTLPMSPPNVLAALLAR